ncbi:MAG: RNA-binding S4 protein [bacterium]|nr:MAG: RNA-binding S4 protein [bacterium]
MRLDVWLHKVCLMKSRSMAGEACQRGKILEGDTPAKASREIRPNARLTIDLGRGPLTIEVTAVPAGNIPKSRALEFYRVIRDDRSVLEEF